MALIFDIIQTFLGIYLLCIFIWALLSWLPMVAPEVASNEFVRQVRSFLDSIVLPWVRLFSFVKPVQIGGALLDLSALVAILVLYVISRFVVPVLRQAVLT